MWQWWQPIAAAPTCMAILKMPSETFNAKNINTTIEGSFERMKEVCQAAGEAGKPIRGYISTAFHCPFEGKIEPSMVTDIAMRLLDLGVHDVSIGDTIGRANLDEVERLLDVLLVKVPVEKVAMHFHDTFGQAAGNVVASWKKGVTIFDSCTGGIGGCPYAPGAPGNVSTATVVRALRSAGRHGQIVVDREFPSQVCGGARRSIVVPFEVRISAMQRRRHAA